MARRLRGLLRGRFAQARLFCLKTVDSTNRFLLAQAETLPGEALALAREQTAGTGRRGRGFCTRPGQAMHLSFLLRGEDFSALPLLAGLALCQALTRLCGAGFALKWPNDIVCDGRKIAGILCARTADGAVVCGAGVNLFLSPWFFARQGLAHAGSVWMCKGAAPCPEALAAAFAGELEAVLAAPRQRMLALYAARCVTLGAAVRVQGANKAFEGVAVSLTPEGELIVQTQAGRRVVRAGDVSVRGRDGYL